MDHGRLRWAIGVLWDTARAPQPSTNQPTGHQISRQGLYVPKKAYFGAKMAVFGPNILIILGGSQISGTHISGNHLGTSFAQLICSGMARYRPERPILGQDLYSRRGSKCSGFRTSTRHLVLIIFWSGIAPQWTKKSHVWPKISQI